MNIYLGWLDQPLFKAILSSLDNFAVSQFMLNNPAVRCKRDEGKWEALRGFSPQRLPNDRHPVQQGCTDALPTTFGATYLTFFVTLHLLSLHMESMKRCIPF
jgi:hypothetical protein